MAYDEQLADRVRDIVGLNPSIVEKKMFGGLAFLVNGNMSVGVDKENLMVRVGKDNYEKFLAEEDAREMDFTGKPLTGFLYVTADELVHKRSLQKWVERGVDYALSLPVKQKK